MKISSAELYHEFGSMSFCSDYEALKDYNLEWTIADTKNKQEDYELLPLQILKLPENPKYMFWETE